MPHGDDLCIGVGFTTSVTAKDIVAAVKAVLAAQGKIVVLATVAAKAESSALLTAAHELNVPIVSFAPDVTIASRRERRRNGKRRGSGCDPRVRGRPTCAGQDCQGWSDRGRGP